MELVFQGRELYFAQPRRVHCHKLLQAGLFSLCQWCNWSSGAQLRVEDCLKDLQTITPLRLLSGACLVRVKELRGFREVISVFDSGATGQVGPGCILPENLHNPKESGLETPNLFYFTMR